MLDSHNLNRFYSILECEIHFLCQWAHFEIMVLVNEEWTNAVLASFPGSLPSFFSHVVNLTAYFTTCEKKLGREANAVCEHNYNTYAVFPPALDRRRSNLSPGVAR